MSLLKHRFATALVLTAAAVLAAGCAQQAAVPPVAENTGGETDEGTPSPTPEPAPAAAPPQAAPPATTPPPRPAKPQEPPKPRFVTVSIPAGTELEVELLDTLSSGVNQVGDPVRARLTRALHADGRLVAPVGAEVTGTVTEVVPLKKFGGQPGLSMTFDRLSITDGSSTPLVARFDAAGAKQTGRDAAKIGGGAAAGAIIGHQVDGDKGKTIGGLLGGAIGTAVAAKTGKELELAAGDLLLVPIDNEIRIRLES